MRIVFVLAVIKLWNIFQKNSCLC